MSWSEFFDYELLTIGHFRLTAGAVMVMLIVVAVARIVVWIALRLMRRFFDRRGVDVGRRYAIETFFKYFVYFFAVVEGLHLAGADLTPLLYGSAGLLVGVGIGIQQTFNDLASGIILLAEGSTDVGDVVQVGDLVGRVTRIGIRTSEIVTRDHISIIIPNSKLVTEQVINWSTNRQPTRFHVDVGVAYSSDVQQVTELLLEAARSHPQVLEQPAPRVQFRDFGNSSLDFRLFFWTTELMPVEFIRSDLRYRILELFRQHNVEIPFPQRDLWLRNAVQLSDPDQARP